MDVVTEWDANRVHAWLSKIGYPAFESQIKENGISGEILVKLDHEALKDLGVRSVGHRVSILKAIYNLKLEHNVPVELGDYVPPSAEFESEMSMSNGHPDLRKIENAFIERDTLITQLSREVTRLSSELTKLKEELVPVFKFLANESKPLPDPDRQSPIRPRYQNSPLSVTVPGINVSSYSRSPTYQNEGSSAPPSPRSPRDGNTRNRNDGLSESRINNTLGPNDRSLGSIKFMGNQAASREGVETFKAFRVSLDDPCYKVLPLALKKYKIVDDWRQYALFICYGKEEKCLSYEEKPLLLFQKLKEQNLNPVFMLKNIKEIKSPFATAQEIINSLKGSKAKRRTTLLNKDLPPAPHEGNGIRSSTTYQSSPPYEEASEDDQSEPKIVEGDGTAVSIFSYNPERADELKVVVGDVFHIREKSGDWCVVEQNGKQGWVPLNCLLETNINGRDMMDSDSPLVGRGVALFDYQSNGQNELSLKKDDRLRIYKKDGYWLYCEINEARGWAPEWYVRIDKQVFDYGETEVNPTSPRRANNNNVVSNDHNGG